MFNGVPSGWSDNDMGDFIDSVRDGASSLFMTDKQLEDGDVYASFGKDWQQFVKVSSPPKQ